MSEMLDILVDQKKVEEIAALPTAKDVEKKLKKEGVDATLGDVKVLGKVFKAAANKVKVNEDELEEVGGGLKKINWESPKAKKALEVIQGVVGTAVILGTAYEVDKHFNEGKGWEATKGLAGQGLDAVNSVTPGKIKCWYENRNEVVEV